MSNFCILAITSFRRYGPFYYCLFDKGIPKQNLIDIIIKKAKECTFVLRRWKIARSVFVFQLENFKVKIIRIYISSKKSNSAINHDSHNNLNIEWHIENRRIIKWRYWYYCQGNGVSIPKGEKHKKENKKKKKKTSNLGLSQGQVS